MSDVRSVTDQEAGMSLAVSSKVEIGQRVAWLRKQASVNQRDAAELIGVDDPGLFSRIELHGKSFDHERLVKIANAFAGRGQLLDDASAIFNFMLFGGVVTAVLRPHLSLAGQSEAKLKVIESPARKQRRKPAAGATSTYFVKAASDLDERVATSEKPVAA